MSINIIQSARVLSVKYFIGLLLACQCLLAASLVSAQPADSFADVTGDAQRQEGFVPFYWHESTGRVFIEIPVFDQDVLYYVSAATGSGSVELSVDRGILATKVIHFRRSGSKVLVEEQNLDYRALGGSQARAQNVKDSFASSVLAGLPIVAMEDGRVLVDATSLFIRDAGGIEPRLNGNNQGVFRFEASLSGFYPQRMKAFPENTEIETISTFSVSNAGAVIRNVLPDERALTMRIHHSFLKPPEGYTPRVADSRIGVSDIEFRNYANPVNDSTAAGWVTRWRLEKKNPGAAMSEPVKPIIFYLDPAIPDDIREAMRIGTLWWNEAYEAAGFINAVEVREPTPDMDPMDIRYAWVQWIERDERGFSSGGTFRDPRTGEILGSKTRMDSHRIRTIANYWEAYVQADTGSFGLPSEQKEMVLLRQSVLIAHELGHVLGFGHNWASSINDRASVMEYPTPRVRVVDGKLDLSEVFAIGIGEYDKYMVRYSYSEFPAASEAAELENVIQEMREEGILFVPSTDPRWAWYDDLETPEQYLRETMAARKIMLAQYGLDNLQEGEPVGSLRDLRFWMVYLHHRWAIEAGQRFIGGMYHNFVNKGDDLVPTEIVPGAQQREVLALLLDAISPENMILREDLLQLLTPHPGDNLEDMSDDYAFDQLRAAGILAGMVIDPLLDPKRTARMVAFADRDPNTLTLPELVQALMGISWYADDSDIPRYTSLQQVTEGVVLQSLMKLGAHEDTTPQVRAYVLDQLAELRMALDSPRERDPMRLAHYRQAARDIDNYLQDPQKFAPDFVIPAWGSGPRSRYPLPPGPPL